MATFAWLWILGICRRRGRTLGLLLAAFVLGTLLFLGIILWSERVITGGLLNPLQHYSWEGSYFAGFSAWYMAGMLSLLVIVIAPVVRLLWRIARNYFGVNHVR
jgi:hypothetical protein